MKKEPLILMVDDNEDTRMLISMILKRSGFQCETCADGQEALEWLETGRTPDLILADIVMPGMNGYEFFDRVRKNPRWNFIPFIFLSSKDSTEDLRKGRELGVDDYLTKPVMPDALVSAIRGKLKRFEQLAGAGRAKEQ